MRVLVACEFSGIVRDAFAALGHDAWSCDLLPTERPGQHLQRDVREVLDEQWDLMIAHPPCTYLAVSGALWCRGAKARPGRLALRNDAVQFVRDLWMAPILRVAIENPVSVLSTVLRLPDQIIQPWEHGHGETKKTCLWLSGLVPLRPTNVVEGRRARVHNHIAPGPNRWKQRSRTLPGIAAAMAAQWGGPA